MQPKFSGSVLFANGDPAPGVEVRIFDKDAAGQVDDDLTVAPGLSDETGRFSFTYQPLRYLDFHTIKNSGPSHPPSGTASEEDGIHIPALDDIFLPYLRFNYTCNGLIYSHTASMGVFQTRYYLPNNPPVDFKPSAHGFAFVNRFSGYFLPFSTPAFMSSRKVTSTYGLCGGMCSAAYDFALAHRPVPMTSEPPRQGTKLHRYLFQRQMDSLGSLGREVVKVAQWTSLPDDTLVGTLRRTADEWDEVRQRLDQGNPVILALIYVHAGSLGELSKIIFENHQVLAHAYQEAPGGIVSINIYDPNLPGRDDVLLRLVPVLLGEEASPEGTRPVMGLKPAELLAGNHYRDVRGFFAMPYTPVNPPKGL